MGRMHSKGKGMSSSALPYKRSAPSWCKTTAQDVIEQISKLARKGMTPSAIGVLLRDQSGVPQVSACLCIHAPPFLSWSLLSSLCLVVPSMPSLTHTRPVCSSTAQVCSITGSKILRILKAHGLAPEIPEDMYHMIKKISVVQAGRCVWGERCVSLRRRAACTFAAPLLA